MDSVKKAPELIGYEGLGLVSFVAFWLFLTDRDEDKFADKEEE